MTDQEFRQLQDRVRLLEAQVNALVRPSVYRFSRPIVGGTDGLKVGTSSLDKIGFFGTAPVTRRTGTTGLTADATYGGDEIILINEAHQALLAYGLIG